jgi:hypothetical protein
LVLIWESLSIIALMRGKVSFRQDYKDFRCAVAPLREKTLLSAQQAFSRDGATAQRYHP